MQSDYVILLGRILLTGVLFLFRCTIYVFGEQVRPHPFLQTQSALTYLGLYGAGYQVPPTFLCISPD